jgi:hypothetical protein
MGISASQRSIDSASSHASPRAKTSTEASTDDDLSFLPANLVRQCRSLIESFHDIHGFGSLPDILWKFRLAPLIERHRELRNLLRRASTTRSAKKANEGFVEIATALLSLEVLASSFAGWSAIFPVEGNLAREIRQRNGYGNHMPLMEFYLHPPKQISAAAVAALAPRPSRSADDKAAFRPLDARLTGNGRPAV